MSALSRLMALVPAAVIVLAAHAFARLAHDPGFAPAAWLLFVLYGLPVALFRLHGFLRPLEQGVSYLDGADYSPWWGGHQIQSFYIAFPFLEAALRLVPGAYSAWLRLWGSRVGRGVYWTPRVEISDRGLLDIGDRVVFGHKVELYGHAVKARRARLVLYVRKITIGSGVFMGAGSRSGPGVMIEDGTVVPLLSDLYPNRKYGKETIHDAPSR